MILEVQGVTRRFGEGPGVHLALDDVSVGVAEGERVGVIGESGSGKTTLANVVVGLERADEGSARFDGTDLEVARSRGKRGVTARRALLGMGMVFQHPAQTFSAHMTVGEGVAEGLVYRERVSRTEARACVDEVLARVGLPTSYADRYAWELSGGECQRAAVARAVISRPQLLVCDEPTSALDVTVQARVMALLDELCGSLSMACLFITHNLALSQSFCSRLYVMERGRVVEDGPTGQVLGNPQSAMTKRLLSSVYTL